jgi:hypothetical protein
LSRRVPGRTSFACPLLATKQQLRNGAAIEVRCQLAPGRGLSATTGTRVPRCIPHEQPTSRNIIIPTQKNRQLWVRRSTGRRTPAP